MKTRKHIGNFALACSLVLAIAASAAGTSEPIEAIEILSPSTLEPIAHPFDFHVQFKERIDLPSLKVEYVTWLVNIDITDKLRPFASGDEILVPAATTRDLDLSAGDHTIRISYCGASSTRCGERSFSFEVN